MSSMRPGYTGVASSCPDDSRSRGLLSADVQLDDGGVIAGDLVKLHVLVLRDAFEGAEGGVRVDVVTLHNDAFGLADHVAVEQGGPEVICPLSLSFNLRVHVVP
jgi:hypothetical protein